MQCGRVAAALAAIGIERGDRVGIVGPSSPWWLTAALGAQSAGGVTVGAYPTSAPPQLRYVFGHSGARFLFVANATLLANVVTVLDELPDVERVIVFDPTGVDDLIVHGRVESLATFLDRAGSVRRRRRRVPARRHRHSRPRRPLHHRLHVGHHRRAEGRAAQLPQHQPVRAHRDPGDGLPRRRRVHRAPAAEPHRRADVHRRHGLAGGLDDELRPLGRDAGRRPVRRAAHDHVRGAAHLREGAHRDRRRPVTARREPARTLRPRPHARRGLRRRAAARRRRCRSSSVTACASATPTA